MTEEELLAEENLPKGVLYASVACILGAVAWSLISVSTGLQMGYMAIGVGFLVGFAMRQGKGIRPVFGLLGAALALISCVLGDFLSIIGFAAKDYDMTFFEVLAGSRLWRNLFCHGEECGVDVRLILWNCCL